MVGRCSMEYGSTDQYLRVLMMFFKGKCLANKLLCFSFFILSNDQLISSKQLVVEVSTNPFLKDS